MSGHSKWAQIKRQKGITDIKRGATFTKLANAVSIAAREGGGEAETNFRLRLAIEKARQANMPKENIERAIKRGTGELGGAHIEDVLYEAYGPGGVALIIEAATDNKNRTSSEVRSILNKHGGKLAAIGAVAYLFKQRGVLTVAIGNKSKEEMELAIIDAGADDFEEQDGIILAYTEPKETEIVRRKLLEQGVNVTDAILSWEPLANNIVAGKEAEQVVRLLESLENLDDVTAVASNFDAPSEVLGKIGE